MHPLQILRESWQIGVPEGRSQKIINDVVQEEIIMNGLSEYPDSTFLLMISIKNVLVIWNPTFRANNNFL